MRATLALNGLIKSGCIVLVYKLSLTVYTGKEPLLTMCGVFFDEAVHPICRPKVQKRILYNAYKRFHARKFQSATTPSGMIANF